MTTKKTISKISLRFLKIYFSNIRSTRTNLCNVKCLLAKCFPDMLALCETNFNFFYWSSAWS